ncbi:MAG TPA: hypothetical protein DHU55_19910 [Blastocatellia bacterium]|jgi:hypothetical protein|nr:hypothetical protein [Blastocatellia bacterium]
MSKAIIGDLLRAEMTEGQQVDAVLKGHATLKQMSEGLLDGPEKLRGACQEFVAHTVENLPIEARQPDESSETAAAAPEKITRSQRAQRANVKNPDSVATAKQRFGLPKDFAPRLQRYGRSVLIEQNIYRLPNGQDFIPCHPTGTLGMRRHLYALLTSEQYLKGKRGSVYVRTDGRIFDYSVDSAIPLGDIFDTGYTIYDLERTGKYALVPRGRKKTEQAKVRRAAAAG